MEKLQPEDNFWVMMKPFNLILKLFFLGCCFASLGGCAILVAGGIGALGGYAVSNDTVQGTIEKDYEEVWDAAMSVVNIMGKMTKEGQVLGRIDAIVNNARVTVSVAQFTPKLVRLTVKARKSFFPNIATAQDVYIKVVTNLKSDISSRRSKEAFDNSKSVD